MDLFPKFLLQLERRGSNINLKVGDIFKLFSKGSDCKVLKIKDTTITFEAANYRGKVDVLYLTTLYDVRGEKLSFQLFDKTS